MQPLRSRVEAADPITSAKAVSWPAQRRRGVGHRAPMEDLEGFSLADAAVLA